MDRVRTTAARRPRSARAAAGVAIAVVLLLLTACLNADQKRGQDVMNADRRANGRVALGEQANAQGKAQRWAEHLARIGRLEHSTLSSDLGGVCYRGLGENVGVGANVDAVERAFMGSSRHKTNILGTTWNGVGIGVAKRGTQVYVVQVFIRTC